MWRGEISIHSDQYSLALTWYEMRTGQRPFSANNQAELLNQHLFEKPDLSGVAEAEQEVLRRALAKTPDQRFPTCVAFVHALKEALTPAKPEIPAQPRGVKVPVGLLIFAMLAILVTLVAVRWLHPPQPPVSPPTPPRIEVTWQPKDWAPEENATDRVQDLSGGWYYLRLVRNVGGQKVAIVAVPQRAPGDPATFYIMENKVWNSLYAVFIEDPASEDIVRNHRNRPGCDKLVQTNWRDEWRKGGYAPGINPNPNNKPFVGVEGDKEHVPVFRVTVTEAYCFASWLHGLLPTDKQWRKAAGLHEDNRPGPFEPADSEIAVGLKKGPWPVEKGSDQSIYGCRQMASNGREWTRDVADKLPNEKLEIPLDRMNGILQVVVQGQSYCLLPRPLTFAAMQEPRTEPCTAARPDLTFRIVLQR
jgi:hypothetical protein